MSLALPPAFVDLHTASSRLGSQVNVLGVVTDWMAPTPTRGSDWMCSFSVTDPTYSDYGSSAQGLKVRFFRPCENELPAIRGHGDIILMRSLRISIWSGMTIGISSRSTSWVVFPAVDIPKQLPSSQQLKHVKEPRTPLPSGSEMRYAFEVREGSGISVSSEVASTPLKSSIGPLSGSSASFPRIPKEKFALLKDIACDKYHDLLGQVVKTYSQSDRVELYLTDYTSNNLLWNYEWGRDDDDDSGREGDTYNYVPRTSSTNKWPGPFGKMTLTVTLWPPHSYFGRTHVKPDDYVELRNVHIKYSKDHKLEGVLHTDQRHPDKVNVNILNGDDGDDRFKDVLRRKRDYLKKFQKSSESFVAEARGLKRKHVEEAKPLSKTAQKKKRKQEREQLAKAKYRNDDAASEKENRAVENKKQSPEENPTPKPGKLSLNPNGTFFI